MLQREVVRFRAAENQPNPLEVDYWIDITANRYGGIIKYYRNDTLTWEVIEPNPELLKQMIAELKKWVESEISRLEEVNSQIGQLVTYIDNSISGVRTYIDNRIDNIDGSITNINNELNSIDSSITNIQEQINNQGGDITTIEGDISTLQTDMTAVKNRVSSLESTVGSLSTSITSLQSALNNHINRRDNPHVVTRAQLGLATSDNVVFNKVSAPAGFWKE